MSYSQRQEETYVLKACADVENKRFLDIGAFDPVTFSNTRALFERGWTGVLIEPSPKCVRELVIAYGTLPGMDVVCAAVATESRLIKLQVTDDAVSSDNPSVAWTQRGGYLGSMWVQAYTINQILDTFGSFGFVSIDTEGTSVDIFKALLATEMFPPCICVEHDNRILEALQAGRERGYHSIYESEENLVFSL